MKKEIKIITDDETIMLTDLPGLFFLNSIEDDVQIKSNTQEVNGIDGLMVGSNTFSPFELELECVFSGQDVTDYRLFKSKLRALIYQRKPYYVWHSDMPGKKYAVLPNGVAIEDIYGRNGNIKITFQVYKGYSESLYMTDQYSLMSDKWQFESGVMPDADIKYKHTRQKFSIYNGSSDTINPRMRHQLQIWIRLKTTTGFQLVNKTTGDVFEYKGKLETNQSFLIDGAYPYIEKERCGRLTNHGLITLAPGYNDFEIWGTVSNVEMQFIFPFIYR